MAAGRLTAAFWARRGRADLALVDTVVAVSRIPYGRPAELSPEGVLAAWRGTCSTKHLLLAGLVEEAWPEVRLSLWHRVYTASPGWASARWGPEVAAVVPSAGLADVHTFARADLGVGPTVIDVTFPVDDWDGRSDMVLACGPGVDHPGGPDPLASKAALVASHCDPELREGLIAALARQARRGSQP
jgi:hypothetical protein